MSRYLKITLIFCSFSGNTPELLDLPDEMILAIMNEVIPEIYLPYSMIGIGNNRLERLVLDKCHTVNLNFDNRRSPDDLCTERLFFHVLHPIANHIRSLALNRRHLLHFSTLLKYYADKIVFNITHLKINLGFFHHNTGTLFTLGKF